MIRLTRAMRLFTIITLTPVFLALVGFMAYRFDRYMFGWEAQLYWGNSPFIAHQFREAAANDKAVFVADLISKKYFIGKTGDQVRSDLGSPTGEYYNYDTNLTYEVYTDGQTKWDLIFVFDHETGTVSDILVYKSRGGAIRYLIGKLMIVFDKRF
ncbi:MAG: hypothetical protein SGJ18_04510 [Pseudomonadota bacterium]|nr:hypothetical protein [Pseudomonadota bacterium]